MKWFRDLAIGRKLTLVMMLVSSAAVLLAGTTAIIYEVASFRKVIVQDLSGQADIIGENCAAALEFENPRTAQETLVSLKARPDIVAACVYRKDGSILAGYLRDANAPPGVFPRTETDGHRVEGGDLLFFHRIFRKGEALGTVYLRSNLRPHYTRLTIGIAIALGAMLASWLLAYALAARLQRIISEPILALAGVAEQVSNRHDYSLRANKRDDDEIGLLTATFNRMLEDIQERDAKLHVAYSDLQFSEQRFRQLTEAIKEVFWMTNPQKNEMIYISPVYEQIWGRTCQSLYGNPRSFLEAIHPEDQERVFQATLTKQTSGNYDEEYRIVRPDGSIRWIRDRAFPIRDKDGKVYRIAGIAEDITERKQAEEALRQLSAELLRSQDEERRRIARELHDATGQKLAVAAMHLSMIDVSMETIDPAARKTVADSLILLNQCLREIRTLSYLLHPPLLDDRGLASALRWYMEGFTQRSGIQVDLNVSAELQRFPQDIELALFRIVQEGLMNTHRHSGSAKTAIRLRADQQSVHMEMQDAGKGFSPQQPDGLPMALGVGIASMRERVKQLGGQIEIESGSNGTTIRVILPLHKTTS